jgi:hypothetical protein
MQRLFAYDTIVIWSIYLYTSNDLETGSISTQMSLRMAILKLVHHHGKIWPRLGRPDDVKPRIATSSRLLARYSRLAMNKDLFQSQSRQIAFSIDSARTGLVLEI